MIRFVSKPFTIPNFPLIEQALNHFRISIENVVRDVNRCPLISGNHLQSQSITTSWVNYEHKLGRTPTGWIVTYCSAQSSIDEDISLRTAATITLRGSAAATVDIWVF